MKSRLEQVPSTGDRIDFSGRTAVVTGGGARGDGIGNGRAAAILLARAGADVVVVDRGEEAAQGTVEMIENEGGAARLFIGDVTSEEDCAALAAFAREGSALPTVLINNVGIGAPGTVLDTEPDFWDRVMKVNVASMYLVSRALIPSMEEAGGGSIVNISSISAIRPNGLTPYSTSKGAVISLTRAMAVDHAGDGIRVNAVLPGPVWTPMVQRPTMTPEIRERRKNASALRIEGTGWDVGRAVVFLASEHARYITGQALVVDGGVTVLSPVR